MIFLVLKYAVCIHFFVHHDQRLLIYARKRFFSGPPWDRSLRLSKQGAGSMEHGDWSQGLRNRSVPPPASLEERAPRRTRGELRLIKQRAESMEQGARRTGKKPLYVIRCSLKASLLTPDSYFLFPRSLHLYFPTNSE